MLEPSYYYTVALFHSSDVRKEKSSRVDNPMKIRNNEISFDEDKLYSSLQVKMELYTYIYIITVHCFMKIYYTIRFNDYF